jgi:uncharacterized protein YjbJ (UPF0337 family)
MSTKVTTPLVEPRNLPIGKAFFAFKPNRDKMMDKDRIEGSANQAKGTIKQAAGKLTGDAKLKAEGAADKANGKLQNAIGGTKDALRGAGKH